MIITKTSRMASFGNWSEATAWCLAVGSKEQLNDWEFRFLESIRSRRTITDRQRNILGQILFKLGRPAVTYYALQCDVCCNAEITTKLESKLKERAGNAGWLTREHSISEFESVNILACCHDCLIGSTLAGRDWRPQVQQWFGVFHG